MHDLIREMGQEIVREESFDEPGNRSHLWSADDIHQVLMNNTVTIKLKTRNYLQNIWMNNIL